jgi:hypothetical protein
VGGHCCLPDGSACSPGQCCNQCVLGTCGGMCVAPGGDCDPQDNRCCSGKCSGVATCL